MFFSFFVIFVIAVVAVVILASCFCFLFFTQRYIVSLLSFSDDIVRVGYFKSLSYYIIYIERSIWLLRQPYVHKMLKKVTGYRVFLWDKKRYTVKQKII